MNEKGSMTTSAIAIAIIALIIGVVIGIGAYPSIFPEQGDVVEAGDDREDAEIYSENVIIIFKDTRSLSYRFGTVKIVTPLTDEIYDDVYYRVLYDDAVVKVYISEP